MFTGHERFAAHDRNIPTPQRPHRNLRAPPQLYDGDWVRGKRHGKGKMQYTESGTTAYTGDWVNDRREVRLPCLDWVGTVTPALTSRHANYCRGG